MEEKRPEDITALKTKALSALVTTGKFVTASFVDALSKAASFEEDHKDCNLRLQSQYISGCAVAVARPFLN